MTSVAVVIPCHNERSSVLRCLGSLREDATLDIRPIVVDDGSTDGTAEAVASTFPRTVVLRGDGNLWWSGAVNRGIEAALVAKADYVLLLNNDCVLSVNDIGRLHAVSVCWPKSIVSAVIGDLSTGRPICFGGRFSPHMLDYLTERQPPTQESALLKSVVEVQWLPGHTMFMPHNIFRAVGLMDERGFPQYFGDADFALRAREQGYLLLVDQDLLVLNDRETTGVSATLSLQPKKLLAILLSRRSWLRVDDNMKFWWRYRHHFTFRQVVRRYEFIYSSLIGGTLDRLRIRSVVRSIRRSISHWTSSS